MPDHVEPDDPSADSGDQSPPVDAGTRTEKIEGFDASQISRPPSATGDDTAKFAPIQISDLSRSGSGPPSIPGYDIVGELGRGGMGVVCKAWQVKHHRFVALKMITAGSETNRVKLKRFKAEAETVARLSHPNIIQIYEVGEHHGSPYIAIEFCPGGTLAKKLAGTPLQPQAAAVLVTKLAEAMGTAHAQRIIHRDLKPANILLTAEGEPKIGDFGLAKRLAAEVAGKPLEQPITQTGAVMGTPSYMPPEQAWGDAKSVGPTADIYALGAILYECLTGRPPFKAASAVDTLEQVRHQQPVPPRLFDPRIPVDLETIVLKCLHKEPTERYANAHDLADDLRLFLVGEPIKAATASTMTNAIAWVQREPSAAGRLIMLVALGAALITTAICLILAR